MFDIGFWELLVVGVVGLLVIGPERLPTVARTAGLWFGKARRFLGSVKADIDRELKAEELKRIMEQQAKSSGLYDMMEGAKSSVQELQAGLDSLNQPVETPAAGETGRTQETAAPQIAPDDAPRSSEPPRHDR